MWIRTKDRQFYIHEIRGAVYVSWVSEKDKANAAGFPENKIDQWVSLMKEMTGLDLEAIEPHV